MRTRVLFAVVTVIIFLLAAYYLRNGHEIHNAKDAPDNQLSEMSRGAGY